MKKTLLSNLQNDIYCRIKSSKKHGVGVFAIRDIPKNSNPFKVSNSECMKQRLINIDEKDIKAASDLSNEREKYIDLKTYFYMRRLTSRDIKDLAIIFKSREFKLFHEKSLTLVDSAITHVGDRIQRSIASEKE